MKTTEFIWKNGKLVPWAEATTHVLSHALHYGTGVFEGVRAYDTANGPSIFRAKLHFDRLIDSAKIIEMKSLFTSTQLLDATKDLIVQNKLKSCYIRPLLYFGYGEMGLNPGNNPVDAVIAAWEWGTYLGEEGLKNGIRCKISSWARLDSRIMPPLAKSTANYLNSALAKREAVSCGFDEAILLNINGTIAEGPGENLFLVKNGCLYTNSAADCALQGITSQSIIQVAKDLGIPFEYKSMIRDELFLADELFFTGTAAEVTPIREIDGRIIGSGKRGSITETIQNKFFEIVSGKDTKYSDWLTPCS
ncbi:branched chain amino acid aminotransferase [Candidatus Marinamargulisbacteria bacterium SCGC AAA071-K20]|nr:branched chain amino acid aminotransferase [Candidatus Marinamargulisbacteria bacterium SCGC AAA071-K20]